MVKPLKEGLDYYLNGQGLFVLTAHYLKARGYCCENGCTHCPYGYSEAEKKRDESIKEADVSDNERQQPEDKIRD